MTFAIAIALLRLLFPNDQKTLAVLKGFYEKAKAAIKGKRQRRAEQKRAAGKPPKPVPDQDVI